MTLTASTNWDVIVIGTGPAGIGGATALAERGLRVLALDEAPAPGGLIWRGIERSPAARAALLGPDYLAGRDPVARLRASGATLAFSTGLWRAEADGTVWLRGADGISRHHGRQLLLATGAMERPAPCPGWTLPGVTTVGGLQLLLKREGLLPEGPLVLAGTGPLVYLFAAQCVAAGKRDLTLLDTADPAAMMPALAHLQQALFGKGAGYLTKGLRLLLTLRRAGIVHHTRVRDLRIEAGPEDGLTIDCRIGRRRRRFEAARIGLHEGVIPETHLSRSLGCAHDWSQEAQAFLPRRDTELRSSLERVFIAGDGGRIGGAMAALLEGRLAACGILSRDGRGSASDAEREARRLRKEIAAHLAPRPFLDRLYRPRAETLAPPNEAIVCRCEEVRAEDIRAAIADGASGPNQIKAFLRTGMGPCQGRMCGPVLSALCSSERAQAMDDVGMLTVRDPLRPISVGELAALDEGDC
ncbi:FAD/NAD(P)-dependent oxidoreductase [Rhodobium gokarnense]|uniref:NADPH-dependent 2,4-dienoyl-CoA reductase/sulfur reductase-like enzyme n=1 Tax=Rhodobium gokarnense TaxID=364296 RepID=A0ABT3HBE8_9HYPH|nr:NAD(P)/FAD-dependent oxidoreductase [Rhodobium gokarnense]MCW2307715.1 NADPH-dependent 2,4-dienoyl-CoA reductase/sulfur reductase-like enzyme [Rhodobium gokarnense]